MFLATLTALAFVLAVPYFVRYRHHPADEYSPIAAWLRAGLYFLFCLLLGHVSGALPALLASPVMYPGQLSNPWWLLSTGVVVVFIIVAYWIYWYRNTLRFGRRLSFVPQLLFGLAWGFTSGLLFLSFWHFADTLVGGFGRFWVWLLAYIAISVWQALWMDMVWDVWVSPEHDTPESIRQKVPRTHIPNMTLCLTYFAVFGNGWIFVGLQTLALLAASFGMRLPPPWSREATPAARQVPGLFGLPRAGGYVEAD